MSDQHFDLPFDAQKQLRWKEVYPPWFSSRLNYAQLSRTVVIEGITKPSHQGVLSRYFAKKCGDGDTNVVQECEVVTQRDGSLHAYLRFKAKTMIETDTGNREELDGTRAAYKAVQEHSNTRVDLSDQVTDVRLQVRPAVFRGFLWVGELPDTADNELVESIITVHGKGHPQNFQVSATKHWGIVQMSSDELAASVLCQSWESMVCVSELPWPVSIEVWAPNEGRHQRFVVSLSNQLRPPPHFVSTNTLEFDFALRWKELGSLHKKQKEKVKGWQWRERHELMAKHRPQSEHERWKSSALESQGPVSRLRQSIFVKGLVLPPAELQQCNGSQTPLYRIKTLANDYFQTLGEVKKCLVTEMDSRGSGQYAASVQFKAADVAEKALEHLSREETPFGIVTAVPLMHDKALWINCLEPDVHSVSLGDTFGQFGKISSATVATCQLTKRPLGSGVIKWDKWATGCLLIRTMQSEIFVMGGSPRPIDIEPYVMIPARWAAKSPATEALSNSLSVRTVDKGGSDFEGALAARKLQAKHRAEKRWLATKHLKERKELEDEQKARLDAEYKALMKLEAVSKAKRDEQEREEASRKRAREQSRPENGGWGQDESPWSNTQILWQGEMNLHVDERQMKDLTVGRFRDAVQYRFCASAFGNRQLYTFNPYLPWEPRMTVVGMLGREDAIEDCRKKMSRTFFMRISLGSDLNPEEERSLREMKSLIKTYNKALILFDVPQVCGRLYIFDSTIEVCFSGLPPGCPNDSLLGALVLPEKPFGQASSNVTPPLAQQGAPGGGYQWDNNSSGW